MVTCVEEQCPTLLENKVITLSNFLLFIFDFLAFLEGVHKIFSAHIHKKFLSVL